MADEGFQITARSIQRDLQELSDIFPLIADERNKPFGWSWDKNAPALDVPGLTGAQALTFALVERHLTPLLPESMLADIRPYFKAAEQRLNSMPRGRGLPTWSDKMRAVPATQALLAPRIDTGVQQTVYEALLQNRQLKLAYHKRGADSQVEYTAHPLAVVMRGAVTYLVCTLFHYQDVRLLPLHRILSAIALDDVASRSKGFDLDAYIHTGALDFGNGQIIRLEAVFHKDAAAHLDETPLSKDQKILPLDAEQVRVTATVLDTPQLVWWLLAFGDQVKVLKPKRLRDALAATATSMCKLYCSN